MSDEGAFTERRAIVSWLRLLALKTTIAPKAIGLIADAIENGAHLAKRGNEG
jgi:hypothetical protein